MLVGVGLATVLTFQVVKIGYDDCVHVWQAWYLSVLGVLLLSFIIDGLTLRQISRMYFTNKLVFISLILDISFLLLACWGSNLIFDADPLHTKTNSDTDKDYEQQLCFE